MVVTNGMYYVYRHIRIDKNEPFYIGIGTILNGYGFGITNIYQRAFSKTCRNNLWKRITSKTKYKIEIIFHSDNLDNIKQKEIEFIKLYGRKDIGTGCLANLTDGGDGNHNYKPSRSALVNRSKPVYQYDKNGHFIKHYECIGDASKLFSNNTENISFCCRRNSNKYTAHGFMWFYKYKGEKTNEWIKRTIKTVNNLSIYSIEEKSEIREDYLSIRDAERKKSLKRSGILYALSKSKTGKPNLYMGYKWFYN